MLLKKEGSYKNLPDSEIVQVGKLEEFLIFEKISANFCCCADSGFLEKKVTLND